MKKECPVCCELIDEHAQICPCCHEQTGFSPVYPSSLQPETQRNRKSVWLWVVMALLCAVIGLLSYFLFVQKHDNSAVSEQDSAIVAENEEFSEDEELSEIEEQDEETDSKKAEASVGRGELGRFDLRGPVRKCVTAGPEGTVTHTFNKDGIWLTTDGKTLKQMYSPDNGYTIERDKAGRVAKISDGFTYDEFNYNSQGLVTSISYYSGETTITYKYDADGYIIKETKEISPEMGSDDPAEIVVRTFAILEKDDYGNWTKRKDQKGNVETRKIMYFEDDSAVGKAVSETADAGENEIPETTAENRSAVSATTKSEAKPQKKPAQNIKIVQKKGAKPRQNQTNKSENTNPPLPNNGTGFHFERVERVP